MNCSKEYPKHFWQILRYLPHDHFRTQGYGGSPFFQVFTSNDAAYPFNARNTPTILETVK